MSQIDQRLLIATIMRETGGSGLQTYLNTFHTYLKRRNVASTIVTPFCYSPLINLPLFGVRKLVNILNKKWSLWWYEYWHYYILKQVLKPILHTSQKQGTTSTVYAQCPLSAKAALKARKGKSQKVFLVIHFNISQADEWVEKKMIAQNSSYYKSIKAREAAIISKVDGIVYVSEFMRNVVEKTIQQAKYIPSVCLPCFTTNIGSSINGMKSSRDLICIGTLETRKNQAYLLNVLFYAKQKGHRYTLTLIGGGPDLDNLKNLSKALDISDQVAFLGYQANAAKFLASHRIYVHSAFIENMPISLIEALADRLPILAAPVGGIPEIFEDSKEGFYWPLEDPVKGAEILIRIMQNDVLYQQLAASAKRRYTSRFETVKIADQLLSFLEQ